MIARLFLIWSLLWAPLWLFGLHPLWRRRKETGLWVIGGHRGRLYADNSREVLRAARAQNKRVVWIANAPLAESLSAQGIVALARHSWAARRTISTAQVLIYSHGEDDLDLLMLLLRGRSAPRVYLGHSLSLLKAGGVLDPTLDRGGRIFGRARRFLMTDCDVILAASEAERETLRRQYPKPEIRLGGGAHLQAWRDAEKSTPQPRIYWFPTFRDSGEANEYLASIISEVCASLELKAYLLDQGLELYVGTHINVAGSQRPQLKPPFYLRPPQHLVEEAAQSQLLISDYSGVVFDYLLLERPEILFAFDLKDYLKRRNLLKDYETLHFALLPKTSAELIEMLVTDAWRSPSLVHAASNERREALPCLEDGFALASVHAIDDFLKEKGK